jgi:hypothetical protein
MLRCVLAAIALAASMLRAAPALAVDEIQVYNGEIAGVRQFTLQQHLNYGFRARRAADYPGALIANGALNGTPEFAYGVTPWYEVGLYLPFAARDDRFYPGGFKLRNLLVSPGAAERDVFFGLNTELSWQPRRFSRSFWNLEFRPILGARSRRWEFITNPIVDFGIGGRQPSAFVPANRIAYAVREDWALGVETYSDTGPVGRFLPFNKQAHQVFAVTDFSFGRFGINFGVGRGLTPASDRWVVKTILGWSF